MIPDFVQPGRYRVLDHRGRLEGVLVVEHARAGFVGGLSYVCRWAGHARSHEVPAAELDRMALERVRWP